VKGWIRIRIKAKNSEDLEAHNGSMEAVDAHNLCVEAQKNGAIEAIDQWLQFCITLNLDRNRR
jgi:hypothetical protein